MSGVIKTLQRDLSDHQEVEKELAKRSHFCQQVIKKYKAQIVSLNEEYEQLLRFDNGESLQQRDENDLVDYLNDRISSYETKLKQTQIHLKSQEEEYEGLLDKVWSMRSRYGKSALLLTEFVESFVEKEPGILGN